MSDLDYESLAELLQTAGVGGDGAELHGELCGRLCAPRTEAGEAWLAAALEAVPDGDARVRAESGLRALAGQAAAALEAADMSFSLLLPDDAEPLEERAQALAGWCQGFLHGLGLAAVPERSLEQDDIAEILRDFAEISKAAFTVDETAEEGEAAYAELVEFVRVSVQLVFEELRAATNEAPAEGARPH